MNHVDVLKKIAEGDQETLDSLPELCKQIRMHPNACSNLGHVDSIKRAIHFTQHRTRHAADMFCIATSFCTG
ncbi:unnamed protein product [Bursaphelenchus okinawaensis]|uniref:Uncharacterized protein n=1 Tax=Bursaphelenchus okinawaensis TaxID=465554 RepID=A0A811LCW5_9BILA|nr:unnamed protein product [Bursaphelenchus okinawaensis]CAG9121013.1 unnamed protein product [Bursaphelenchus okinawaensis]